MDEVRIDIDIVGIVDVPIDEIIEQLKMVRAYAKAKGIYVLRRADKYSLVDTVITK